MINLILAAICTVAFMSCLEAGLHHGHRHWFIVAGIFFIDAIANLYLGLAA